MKLAALGDGLQVEVAGKFVIEGEIAEVDVRVDSGRVRCAGSFEEEVGAPFDGEAVGIELANAGEIEIISRYVEAEGAGGGVVGGASGDDGIVMKEMDVIESEFAVGEVEGGVELPNSLTVDGAVVEVDPSVGAGIGLGACGLQEEVGSTGDGIVVSGEGLERGEVGVVKVGAQGESAGAGEVAVLERCGGVELGGSVVAAEGCVTKCDSVEGELQRGGKRIPVSLDLRRVGCGRDVEFKIIEQKIACQLRRGKSAAHVASEGSTAFERDRKQRGAANQGDKRKPVRETGSGNGEAECGRG
ncbi:MAG: hypothetical protein ACLP56_02840 [Candidatus Sulfotelmatobacter sp.]